MGQVQAEVVSGHATGTVVFGMLTEASGTARKISDSGDPMTCKAIQVCSKVWVNGNEPTAPTETDWDQVPAVQSSDITCVNGTYTWVKRPVTPAGTKNTLYARATWVVSMYPPPEVDVIELSIPEIYPATLNADGAISAEASRAADETGDPEVAPFPDFVDLLPKCVEDGWLRYEVPANLVAAGGRLMLTERSALRVMEMGVAAENVNWQLGINILGVRRACGPNLSPAPRPFRFESLPQFGIVVTQYTRQGTPVIPFAVLSQSRHHSDIVVLDPGKSIFVRINVWDEAKSIMMGGYTLWINPRVGFPTCPSCEPPCS